MARQAVSHGNLGYSGQAIILLITKLLIVSFILQVSPTCSPVIKSDSRGHNITLVHPFLLRFEGGSSFEHYSRPISGKDKLSAYPRLSPKKMNKVINKELKADLFSLK